MSHRVAHDGTGAPPRPWYDACQASAAFLLVASLLFALVAAVGHHAVEPRPLPPGFRWLEGWVRFDSGWYYDIASRGYFYTPGSQSSVAFFPTYPLTMRMLGYAIPSLYVAGVLITAAAGLVSAVAFYRWCSARFTRRESAAALGLLLLYPYSLYLYGAVYSDGLFLATALGAFLLLERGHPWWAGLLGALATAGRPVGIAVAVGLIVRVIEIAAQRAPTADAELAADVEGGQGRLRSVAATVKAAMHQLRWQDGGVLLSASGLVGYCLYLWAEFGDPLAFSSVQSAAGWQEGTGPRVWFKIALFKTLVLGTPVQIAPVPASAILWLVAVLLIPRLPSRFGWGYTCYVVLIVAIPGIGTKDFMGSGRFLLAAFPLFAVAGQLLADLRPRWALPAFLGLSGAGLGLATFLYATGFQIA